MDVEFVTLGQAAKMLNTPAPTLRGWADKLEELSIHYLERNHRKERVFYDTDIEIFKFMAQQKDEHKRSTTTTDLAYVIAESDHFMLRQRSQVPDVPQYKAKLGEIDVDYLMQQPAFRNFFEDIVSNVSSNVSNEVSKEVTEKVTKEVTDKLSEEFNEKLNEIEDRRSKKIDEFITEQRRTQEKIEEYMNLSFFQKLFTKNPMKDKE